MQMLLQSENQIEHYEIMKHGGVSYLIYKLQSEHKPHIFAVDVTHLGDISLTEYILCKEKTMEELKLRCKENERNIKKACKRKDENGGNYITKVLRKIKKK